MSLLVLDAASLVSPDARGELDARDVWTETLRQVRSALLQGLEPTGVEVVDDERGAVLWDTETLGSPAPATRRQTIPGLLAHVAATAPRTWDDVTQGRYAVGSLGGYLLARATRGLQHGCPVGVLLACGLVDADGGWDEERRAALGLPRESWPDVLPEPLADGAEAGRSDPGCLAGLAVPVSLRLPRP